MRRVGLLMVGHVAPSAVPIGGDYPELFAALLDGLGIELVRYDLDRGVLPASVDECDGWLCSPSRCSTYDGHRWICDAEELLRELVRRERPYVGICFGHQLLAQALGTPVRRAADGWLVGVHDYEIVAPQPWMDPARDRVALLASHEDQVAALPDGAQLLATTPGCPVSGLLVGERAWTLQPHPEFTAPLAEHLYAMRRETIGDARTDAALASLARPLDRLEVGRWIAKFFADQSP
ncbi:MAG: hypothetical protein FJW88_10925 [Actinobacteria bacterium]|nr:hypothetical protein [Actinomycetota bacterium]